MNSEKRIKLFFDKVIKTKTCWIWVGGFSHGYGQFFNGKQAQSAHRFSYANFKAPIKPGREMHIDHICKNTRCVNPEHLEYVSRRENLLRSDCPSAINKRKKECIRGHKFTPENTYVFGAGNRNCKKCKKSYSLEYQTKLRQNFRQEKIRNPSPKKIWPKKSQCIRGHSFDADNTYMHNGKQHCRVCRKIHMREYSRKARDEKRGAPPRKWIRKN